MNDSKNTNLKEKIRNLKKTLNVDGLEVSRTDPYYFLTEFCFTMDEHWESKGLKSAYNKFPEKEYIRDLCDLFQTQDLLVIEKSRQMMVSWIFIC